MKPKYGDTIKMVYTDTDQTDDIDKDLNAVKNEMECSDDPKEHRFYDVNNEKVLGKFKDELKSKITTGMKIKAIL